MLELLQAIDSDSDGYFDKRDVCANFVGDYNLICDDKGPFLDFIISMAKSLWDSIDTN